jgi:large subunit ribosomal protein L11
MDMAKNVIRKLKLELEAGKANPAKVGKDLAPTGINLLAFCQKYNELTAGQQGLIIPAEITVFEDRSFAVQTKTPPTAFLLKRAAGIEKGAGRPGHETVATLTREDLQRIAEIKWPDLNTTRIEQAVKMIEGTALSMGIQVVD